MSDAKKAIDDIKKKLSSSSEEPDSEDRESEETPEASKEVKSAKSEKSATSTEGPGFIKQEVCLYCGCAHSMQRPGYDGCNRLVIRFVCRNCGKKWSHGDAKVKEIRKG